MAAPFLPQASGHRRTLRPHSKRTPSAAQAAKSTSSMYFLATPTLSGDDAVRRDDAPRPSVVRIAMLGGPLTSNIRIFSSSGRRSVLGCRVEGMGEDHLGSSHFVPSHIEKPIQDIPRPNLKSVVFWLPGQEFPLLQWGKI